MTYTPIVPYADETFGNAYFAQRMNTVAWDGADSTSRVKALVEATMAIDRLNFTGSKHDEAQANEFPRGADTTVPEAISKACCELAMTLLDDVDADIEVQNVLVATQTIGATTIHTGEGAQFHVMAGIPSIRAWNYLLPFLRDGEHFRLTRDS